MDEDRLRMIWERDVTGKLTQEAKYEIEKLQAEKVLRDRKKSGREKIEEQELYVPLEPELVLRKKAKGKVMWLEKAFRALREGRIPQSSITKIYEILAAPTFCDDWHFAQSKKAHEMFADPDNLRFFTQNQQKYLQSDRFKIQKTHAVVNLLSSDEEEEEMNVRGRNAKKNDPSAKPMWLIRQERRQQGLPSDSEAEESEAGKDRKRDGARRRSRDRRSTDRRGRDDDTRRRDRRSRSRGRRRGDSRGRRREGSGGRRGRGRRRSESRRRGRGGRSTRDDSRRRGKDDAEKKDDADASKAQHAAAAKGSALAAKIDVEAFKKHLEEKKNNPNYKGPEKPKKERDSDDSSDSDDSDSDQESVASHRHDDDDGDDGQESSDSDGAGGRISRKKKLALMERAGKQERRIDPTDENMYSLEEFCAAYGGTPANPPRIWQQQRHTSHWFSKGF
ncbi:unnamed protein product [Amoebophrya sp. A25]|nr:unnamed protein product [Amoebophrya sp. A25]|eukprot:GSA25T00001734001.1